MVDARESAPVAAVSKANRLSSGAKDSEDEDAVVLEVLASETARDNTGRLEEVNVIQRERPRERAGRLEEVQRTFKGSTLGSGKTGRSSTYIQRERPRERED